MRLKDVGSFSTILTQAILLLIAAIIVVMLVSSASLWLYSPWFWAIAEILAVAGTVTYSLRKPPALTVNGSAVPKGKVITLRCILNTISVALLRHLIFKLNEHSKDLPFWLLIEIFLFPNLIIGWGLESGSVEAAILTPPKMRPLRIEAREAWRGISEGMIIPVVSVFYWATAVSAFIAVGLALSPVRWMPGWGVWVISWLIGGVFGFVMADAFVRLPRIKSVFEAAEVNGATGERISNEDVFIPYTIIVFLVTLLVPVFVEGRSRHHLPPLTPPHFLVYIPVVLGLVMAAVTLWAWIKRDPAEAEHERQADEEKYQGALAENQRVRERLIACAGTIIEAWDEGRTGRRGNLWLTEPLVEQLDQGISGQAIAYGLPGGDALIRAQDFLVRLLDAAREGSANVPRDQPLRGRGQASGLSWEEAIEIVADMQACLRAGRALDNPRLLHFLGERQASSGERTMFWDLLAGLLRPILLAVLVLVVLSAPVWGIDLLCFLGRTLADVTGLSKRFDRDTLTGFGVGLIEVPIITAVIVALLRGERAKTKEP